MILTTGDQEYKNTENSSNSWSQDENQPPSKSMKNEEETVPKEFYHSEQ